MVTLSLDGSEALTFDPQGPSGWAAYHSPATHRSGFAVQLRFGPVDVEPTSPLQIYELHLATHRDRTSWNSPLLRTLPFGRMVAAINRDSVRDQLRPLLMPANTIETHGFSPRTAWTLPPASPPTMPAPELKLEVPEDRRKPDEFYARVADAYLAQATISNRPAHDLAEANDVPKSTAHRWLKEARSRGLLRLPNQQLDHEPFSQELVRNYARGDR
ncbi:hypothetical protein SAMN04488107_0062 [Geodermatophilus saharensis]|uniref:Uncharacterized protein n=1 Tax=Geodermatophilus saharensis TaxID=1137994 RepID=A0A238ZI30_9ACTN|nr:hypothetical protein SAMN04488107_0062 [Geodermatophilus saharensis]